MFSRGVEKRANHCIVIVVWIEEEKWKQIDSRGGGVISSSQLIGIEGKCNLASFHRDLWG